MPLGVNHNATLGVPNTPGPHGAMQFEEIPYFYFNSGRILVSETEFVAAGLSTADAITATVLAAISASQGLGAPTAIGVAFALANGSSTGLGTPLGVGANYWASVAASAGVTTPGAVSIGIFTAEGSVVCLGSTDYKTAALWATIFNSSGIGTALGDMEIVEVDTSVPGWMIVCRRRDRR